LKFMLNKKNNIKIMSARQIISFLIIVFISAAYFSSIPFDVIFSTSAESCCTISAENDSAINEYAGNGCSCCPGVCRCAFKDKSPAGFPFNGVLKVHVIPDFPEYGDNFFAIFNIFALIFKDPPPRIDTVDFNSKVPIYRLKSSMLC